MTILLDGSEFLWGLGFFGKPPLEESVYELASSIDLIGC